MGYDLDLFLELNEEYRSKPIVPAPRSLSGDSLLEASRKRAADLDKKLGGIAGKRILEVGCGRGHFCRILADEFQCEVTGVDIRKYPDWDERPDLQMHRHDIASLDNDFLGAFDTIVSFAVWEHVEHPYSALKATRGLLKDDGKMYLYANLYRGPQASHRYREIFFPWPHLLFTDEVIEEYYVSIGKRPTRAAWVNKLTHAHYLNYFEMLDFDVERQWVSKKPIDEAFYRRFEDILGRYPRFDLERDFIYAIVTPRRDQPGTGAEEPGEDVRQLQTELARAIRQRDRHARRLAEIKASRSWRVTEPLRKVRSLGR